MMEKTEITDIVGSAIIFPVVYCQITNLSDQSSCKAHPGGGARECQALMSDNVNKRQSGIKASFPQVACKRLDGVVHTHTLSPMSA